MALEFSGIFFDTIDSYSSRLRSKLGLRNQQLLFLALRVRRNERLDLREDFDESGEERLLRQLFEPLIQHQRVCEIAGRFWISGREQVSDQIGVLAQDVRQRNASRAGRLQSLVIDREENRAEQARSNQVVEQLRKFLRVTILDDPEKNRGAQILFGLPTLECRSEFVGVALFDEKVDALGREFAL